MCTQCIPFNPLQIGDHRSKQGVGTTASINNQVQDKQVLCEAISPQNTITFIDLLKTTVIHITHTLRQYLNACFD